ncbi:MAG: hypothetical protein L0229_30265 [Blastocatellia bacterium]|nr:hypothetical protein [Blastocatellia bacterium]
MLTFDSFFGLFSGTLSEASSYVESASGAGSSGFISQIIGRIFFRPEDFDEVRKHPDIKMNEGDEKESFTRVQVLEVDARSAAHRVRRPFFMSFLHQIIPCCNIIFVNTCLQPERLIIILVLVGGNRNRRKGAQ